MQKIIRMKPINAHVQVDTVPIRQAVKQTLSVCHTLTNTHREILNPAWDDLTLINSFNCHKPLPH